MAGTVRESFGIELDGTDNHHARAQRLAALSTAHFVCEARYDRRAFDYGKSMERSIKFVDNERGFALEKRSDINDYMEVFHYDGLHTVKADDFLNEEVGFIRQAELPVAVIVEEESEIEPTVRIIHELFCPEKDERKFAIDLAHAKSMFQQKEKRVPQKLFVIEFEKANCFPWCTYFGTWSDLKYHNETMPIVLANSLKELDVSFNKRPPTYNNGDVVLVRTGANNIFMAYIVSEKKEGWYLAKDIFTSKCMLVTEYKIQGANVIQGASP